MQALWNNPIFFKHRLLERREYQRSRSNFWLKQMSLVWCVLIPLLWVGLMVLPEVLDSFKPEYNPARLRLALTHLVANWLGALTLSYFVVLMVAIGLAISNTSALVTNEREKKTFESLQSTMMSSSEIVNGRLLSGLWPVFRELLIVSPLALVLGTAASFGFQTLMCLGLLVSTVMFYGAIGLWSSYLTRSTQNANRLAAGIAASLLVGLPVLSMLLENQFLLHLHPVFSSVYLTREGATPLLLLTAFHFCGTGLVWLDALRRERSAVRV